MPYNINGDEYISSKEIFTQVKSGDFYNAVRLNGWQKGGDWRVADGGTTGITIGAWLTSQKWYQAADVAEAVGLTRGRIAAIARKHNLRLSPVGIGKYQRERVTILLDIMGRRADCPKCGGLAVAQKQGGVICLDCKG